MKLDATGAVVWQKVYAQPYAACSDCVPNSRPPSPQAVETQDGGFVVEGTIGACPSAGNGPGILVFKVSSTGSLLWQKAFCGEGTASARSMDITSDGGFIVAGRTSVVTTFAPRNDALVLKLDNTGTLVWEKTYAGEVSCAGGSAGGTAGSSVRQISDGGYIVAGDTCFGTGQAAWLLRLDSGGNVVWQKSYPGSTAPAPYGFAEYTPFSVQQTLDGGFITFGAGPAMILRVNSTGSPIWQKGYGAVSYGAYGLSGEETPDGGFIVAGFNSTGAPEPLVLRLDSMGNILWQRFLSVGSGTTAEASSVQQTSDGGFIVAGVSLASGIAFVFKLDPNGQANSCSSVSTSSLVASTVPFSIYGPPELGITGTAVDITSSSPAKSTMFVPVNTSATSTVLCLTASSMTTSCSTTYTTTTTATATATTTAKATATVSTTTVLTATTLSTVTTSTAVTTVTTTTTVVFNTTTGSGPVPEFPFQWFTVAALTLLVAVSYLFARRGLKPRVA